MAGLQVIRQDDFSGGMWSTTTRERIPANGVADAINCLIDDTGGIYKRGGSLFYAGTGWPATRILWIWQGTLTGGNRTLFATASNLYSINGSTITNLGAYTGMANGAIRPAVINGVLYLPGATSISYNGTTFATTAFSAGYWTSVANRLVGAAGAQVIFSGVGTTTFAGTDFWSIPGGVNITGLTALRDSLVVFTDRGTWVISNMALNLTDAAGNVQQRLDLYSPDLIQWGTGAAGVVGYQGGLVVAARDGVWLMQLGATSETAQPLQLLSRPISNLYRSYVSSGYQPGQAAVLNGHYFLPIVGSGTLAALLVCRLDLPARPWTRFVSDADLGYAFAASQDGKSLISTQIGPSFTGYALATADYFGSTGGDAPFSGLTWSVVSRDFLTGPLNKNTVIKMIAGYHLSSGNLVATARDPAQTSDVSLSGAAQPTFGALSTFPWRVGKRARLMRFTISATGTSTGIALDSLQIFVRSSGRQ